MGQQPAQGRSTDASRPVSRAVLAALPKIELHRHLEGSFRLETLLEFARKRKLEELPIHDVEAFRKVVQMTPSDPPDFLTFLSKFRADWYTTLDDPRRLAYEAVEDAAKENIIYYEMRFSPEHFKRKSDFRTEEVIDAVIAGAREAAARHGIEIAFLIQLGRDKLGVDEMIQYIDVCRPYRDHGVVGIDLAGDEIHFPPELFTRAFQGLHERTGFMTTIHAGEAVGPENVRTSVLELGAARIGHGFRTIEDDKVVDLVLERNIFLEQCLTSNLLTGTVKSIDVHPFPKLYARGVKVTLNVDDPQIQQSDLIDDYTYATERFGFTLEDFKKVNLNSIEAAFQPAEFKDKLRARFLAAFPAT